MTIYGTCSQTAGVKGLYHHLPYTPLFQREKILGQDLK